MKKLKQILSNKNTVTFIAAILIVLVLYFFYNWRINQATSPVRIPSAVQTIPPRTQITKDMIEKKEKNEEIFNKNQNQFMRKVNGEYDDLFHLFDKYVKDFPKWLIKFPMLNIEYIVEDNKVRRKKLSELQEDYASKKYFKGANDEQIEYCYKYLLEEAKKIDENLYFNIKH